MTPRTLAMLGTITVALTVGGCSSDDPTPSPTTRATGQVTVTAAPPSSQPAGAIKELSKITCTKGADGWTFSATLTNTEKSKTAFTVNVAVAKKVGGTVVGSKEIKKTLDPGASAQLEAKNFYAGAEADTDVQCIPAATKAAAS